MTAEPELSRLSEQLGVTPSELAQLVGIARPSKAKSLTRKAELTLRSISSILEVATEMAGDEVRAAIWFKHQPIPACGGATAYDLVGESKANVVVIYLEAVRSGVYA